MKKVNKKETYFLKSLLATALTGGVHYLVFSRFNFYPTIHAILGIILFFFSAALVATLFKK